MIEKKNDRNEKVGKMCPTHKLAKQQQRQQKKGCVSYTGFIICCCFWYINESIKQSINQSIELNRPNIQLLQSKI